MSMKILATICNYSTKSKCYDYSTKLVVGKTKDETAGVADEGFGGLKP